MRKTKIRGKNLYSQWIFGHPFYALEENFKKGVVNAIQIEFDDIQQVKTETITEFTQKFDKNGIEIFEGDIISGCSFNGSYAIGKVVLNGENNFVIYPIGKFLEGYCELENNNNFFTVIGNIFDNPEMLK